MMPREQSEENAMKLEKLNKMCWWRGYARYVKYYLTLDHMLPVMLIVNFCPDLSVITSLLSFQIGLEEEQIIRSDCLGKSYDEVIYKTVSDEWKNFLDQRTGWK